jgi:hypothetical protein
MTQRGFADSFFSPDYAGGLGVLFQKLNQVIPLVEMLIKRGASKMTNLYPSPKPVPTLKNPMASVFKISPKMLFVKVVSHEMTAQVPARLSMECDMKWKRYTPEPH